MDRTPLKHRSIDKELQMNGSKTSAVASPTTRSSRPKQLPTLLNEAMLNFCGNKTGCCKSWQDASCVVQFLRLRCPRKSTTSDVDEYTQKVSVLKSDMREALQCGRRTLDAAIQLLKVCRKACGERRQYFGALRAMVDCFSRMPGWADSPQDSAHCEGDVLARMEMLSNVLTSACPDVANVERKIDFMQHWVASLHGRAAAHVDLIYTKTFSMFDGVLGGELSDSCRATVCSVLFGMAVNLTRRVALPLAKAAFVVALPRVDTTLHFEPVGPYAALSPPWTDFKGQPDLVLTCLLKFAKFESAYDIASWRQFQQVAGDALQQVPVQAALQFIENVQLPNVSPFQCAVDLVNSIDKPSMELWLMLLRKWRHYRTAASAVNDNVDFLRGLSAAVSSAALCTDALTLGSELCTELELCAQMLQRPDQPFVHFLHIYEHLYKVILQIEEKRVEVTEAQLRCAADILASPFAFTYWRHTEGLVPGEDLEWVWPKSEFGKLLVLFTARARQQATLCWTTNQFCSQLALAIMRRLGPAACSADSWTMSCPAKTVALNSVAKLLSESLIGDSELPADEKHCEQSFEFGVTPPDAHLVPRCNVLAELRPVVQLTATALAAAAKAILACDSGASQHQSKDGSTSPEKVENEPKKRGRPPAKRPGCSAAVATPIVADDWLSASGAHAVRLLIDCVEDEPSKMVEVVRLLAKPAALQLRAAAALPKQTGRRLRSAFVDTPTEMAATLIRRKVLDSVVKDQPFLDSVDDLFVAGLNCTQRRTKLEFVRVWNKLFGQTLALGYSSSLSDAVRSCEQLGARAPCARGSGGPSHDAHTPNSPLVAEETLPFDVDEAINVPLVRTARTSFVPLDSAPKHKAAEHKDVKPTLAARPSPAPLEDARSQEFVPIADIQNQRKYLTEHQKEKIRRRDVASPYVPLASEQSQMAAATYVPHGFESDSLQVVCDDALAADPDLKLKHSPEVVDSTKTDSDECDIVPMAQSNSKVAPAVQNDAALIGNASPAKGVSQEKVNVTPEKAPVTPRGILKYFGSASSRGPPSDAALATSGRAAQKRHADSDTDSAVEAKRVRFSPSSQAQCDGDSASRTPRGKRRVLRRSLKSAMDRNCSRSADSKAAPGAQFNFAKFASPRTMRLVKQASSQASAECPESVSGPAADSGTVPTEVTQPAAAMSVETNQVVDEVAMDERCADTSISTDSVVDEPVSEQSHLAESAAGSEEGSMFPLVTESSISSREVCAPPETRSSPRKQGKAQCESLRELDTGHETDAGPGQPANTEHQPEGVHPSGSPPEPDTGHQSDSLQAPGVHESDTRAESVDQVAASVDPVAETVPQPDIQCDPAAEPSTAHISDDTPAGDPAPSEPHSSAAACMPSDVQSGSDAPVSGAWLATRLSALVNSALEGGAVNSARHMNALLQLALTSPQLDAGLVALANALASSR